MDLLAALDLAAKGRGQAEASLGEAGVAIGRDREPRPGDSGPAAAPDPSASAAPASPGPVVPEDPDSIVPRLTPAEFAAYVEDVARELSRRSDLDWLRMDGRTREKWLALARLAIGAVGAASIQRTMRRISRRPQKASRPFTDLDRADIAERELLAGVEA